MDIAYVSAFAALGGSVVGGLISGTATWLAQWAQVRAGHRAHQISHREELFRDFILAASRTYGQALMSNEPDVKELVSMYGSINRMEVLCRPRTVQAAQTVAHTTLEAYLQPNKTFSEILAMLKSRTELNPLAEFAQAAREELRTFASE
jgi:hypothetical protein